MIRVDKVYVLHCKYSLFLVFFFFNDTATTEIYTLSLHDALPIRAHESARPRPHQARLFSAPAGSQPLPLRSDRKSTRLNSSHTVISYAVFCLKKKKHIHSQPPVWNTKNEGPKIR